MVILFIVNNLEPKVPQEKSNILSFLRRNNKMKQSKLKCAARTRIDLKPLNHNHTKEVDSTYFNESMGNQNSPKKDIRCESAFNNYITEPKSKE